MQLYVKGERGKGEGQGEGGGSQGELGEGPGVADLQRCGVFRSRVIQDEYRTWGAQNDCLVFLNKPD